MKKKSILRICMPGIFCLLYGNPFVSGAGIFLQIKSDNHQVPSGWDGIYRGVLPCADCEGTQTTIYLNRNLTYKVVIKYLGKQVKDYEYSGPFTWNKAASTITLQNGDSRETYLAGKGMLTQLDAEGKKFTGDMAGRFVLSKARYALLEKYWKLTELGGKPVIVDSSFRKEPFLTFKNEGMRYSGNGGCNNFSGTFKTENADSITISPGMTTLMACKDMKIESGLLRALAAADHFQITGDQLILFHQGQPALAKFRTYMH